MKVLFLFIIILIYSFNSQARELCFDEAGMYFNIDPLLLKSIGIVESNLNTNVIGMNKNREGKIQSKDYGIMQINQRHVSSLIAQGIINDVSELTSDPCLNIKIGAWILAKHFHQCGVNWPCLGSYNAGFSEKNSRARLIYARKVFLIYLELYRNMYEMEK